MSDRTEQPVVETGQEQNLEHAQIRTLLDRHREQILADFQAEITKHEFQADYDRRSIQKLSETIESQQEELHRAQAEERRRQDFSLLHEQFLSQNWDLREAHEKSLTELEELKRFQGSTIQEQQNEINCLNDSRDFQDAESARSGHSHVTSQPAFFPTSFNSWWNAKPFSRNAEPQRKAAKHLGHAWFFRKRFLRIQ